MWFDHISIYMTINVVINHVILSSMVINRNVIVLIRNMLGQLFHGHLFVQTARTDIYCILDPPLLADRNYKMPIRTFIKWTHTYDYMGSMIFLFFHIMIFYVFCVKVHMALFIAPITHKWRFAIWNVMKSVIVEYFL